MLIAPVHKPQVGLKAQALTGSARNSESSKSNLQAVTGASDTARCEYFLRSILSESGM